LAAEELSNVSSQRLLALSRSQVAEVLRAQGKLVEAQAAFAEYLAISRRLAELDPSNARWQQDLATVCAKIARRKDNAISEGCA